MTLVREDISYVNSNSIVITFHCVELVSDHFLVNALFRGILLYKELGHCIQACQVTKSCLIDMLPHICH